jgi:hypothetical protein
MSDRWTTGATETYVKPAESKPEDSNALFGLGLLALSLLLFAGTVGVALVYLALD